MADLKNLLAHLAKAEKELYSRQFLAPCVRGGQVRTKIDNLLCTFAPEPSDFEGWGVFVPIDEHRAQLVEEADSFQIAEYLQLFPALRVHLVFALRKNLWLGYPINESDMKQRFAPKAAVIFPFPIFLISEGREFETAVVRRVGDAWFFDELDRRAAPEPAEFLREARSSATSLASLNEKGLTPELRICYSMAERREDVLREREQLRQQAKNLKHQSNDMKKIREALQFGGGELRDLVDKGNFWLVEWTTRNNENHTSAIAKDLTVMSAGICLSGEDAKFDLQSLVGVVEGSSDAW